MQKELADSGVVGDSPPGRRRGHLVEEGTFAGFGAVRAWASLVLAETGLWVEEGVRPYGPPLRDFPGQGQSACSLTVI